MLAVSCGQHRQVAHWLCQSEISWDQTTSLLPHLLGQLLQLSCQVPDANLILPLILLQSEIVLLLQAWASQ